MTPGSSELLQYFYASCLLLVPVYCGLERTCTPEVKSQDRRGMCGSQLTQLISLACMFRGGYNTNGKKRSVDQAKHIAPHSVSTPVANKTLPKTIADFKEKLKHQLVSKRQAASFLVKKSAYAEQGIVCECCYFRCSFGEITDYCQGSGDFFKRSSTPDGKATKIKTKADQGDDGHLKQTSPQGSKDTIIRNILDQRNDGLFKQSLPQDNKDTKIKHILDQGDDNLFKQFSQHSKDATTKSILDQGDDSLFKRFSPQASTDTNSKPIFDKHQLGFPSRLSRGNGADKLQYNIHQ